LYGFPLKIRILFYGHLPRSGGRKFLDPSHSETSGEISWFQILSRAKKTEKEIARNFLGKILNFMQNEK
jgi:hypothetical protein